ncbi:hypothetical protein ACFXTO_001693 [Malus domestica]
MIQTIAPAVFFGCSWPRTSTAPADNVSQGFPKTPPHNPLFPKNDDGWRFGKMEPDAGIGPVNKLNETLKLSNVLQFSKLDGIVPERKFRERSRSVMEGKAEISHGIMPVRELRLRFKLRSFSQCPMSHGIEPLKSLR